MGSPAQGRLQTPGDVDVDDDDGDAGVDDGDGGVGVGGGVGDGVDVGGGAEPSTSGPRPIDQHGHSTTPTPPVNKKRPKSLEYSHEAALELLKRHEGMRLKVYRDSTGILTIGIGRNIEGRGLSEAEALLLAENDIANCEAELDEHLPWWRELSDTRKLVLIDMLFNLGWPRFSLFVRMIDALKRRDYADAAAEMLASRWAEQVGQRSRELAHMMLYDGAPE